jgi:hypothetical protein
MDESIGRLVSSPLLQLLPLLGAFVVVGNRFTERRPGYTLYAISGGIVTTELVNIMNLLDVGGIAIGIAAKLGA